MKEVMTIPLSQGQQTLIYKEDYVLIKDFTWHAKKCKNGFYAVSSYWDKETRKYKKRYMHKLILQTSEMIDHKNRNPLDNRRDNLRICTPAQNVKNSKRINKQYKGITQTRSGGWSAKVLINGKDKYVGIYINKEDAALAHDKAAREYIGEFTYLNFPDISDYAVLETAKSPSDLAKGIRRLYNGKWEARIQRNGKRIQLGTFKNEEDAISAYVKAKEDLDDNTK